MRISPSSKLLFWTTLVLVPAATLALAVPALTGIAALILVGFVLAVIGDAVYSGARLEGIRVHLPEVVRLSKNREGEIEVQFENERARAVRLRVGLPFPPEVTSPVAELATTLPADAVRSRITVPCTGHQRGRFTIENCYLEAASPFG